jgi:hypothetical protein
MEDQRYWGNFTVTRIVKREKMRSSDCILELPKINIYKYKSFSFCANRIYLRLLEIEVNMLREWSRSLNRTSPPYIQREKLARTSIGIALTSGTASLCWFSETRPRNVQSRLGL